MTVDNVCRDGNIGHNWLGRRAIGVLTVAGITDIKVNEDIPDHVFAPPFPAGIEVYDGLQGLGRIKAEDVRSTPPAPAPAPFARRWWTIYVGLPILLLLGAIVAWLRLSRQAFRVDVEVRRVGHDGRRHPKIMIPAGSAAIFPRPWRQAGAAPTRQCASRASTGIT